LGLLALGACAAKTAVVRPPKDLSRIRRVSVVPFEGPGGQAATDAFVRRLMAGGLEVTDARHGGDAVLRGVVTEYKANNTLMVFLGKTMLVSPGGQSVVVDHPIVSPGASLAVPEGTAAGVQKAQVATINAIVAVSARLEETPGGRALWSAESTYEGLDVESALQTVTEILAGSLAQVLPQAGRKSL